MEAGLIPKSEIFPLVLYACPSFMPTWELLQHDRERASDDALHDRAADALCRHIVRMFSRSQTQDLVGTFSVIERLFVEGEPDVQEKIRSLIQTLQNEVRATANPDHVRRLLGTRSAEQWDNFEKYLQASHSVFQWEKSHTGAFPLVNLEAIRDPELRSSLQQICDIYKRSRRRDVQ
jgi:hypothetical protein